MSKWSAVKRPLPAHKPKPASKPHNVIKFIVKLYAIYCFLLVFNDCNFMYVADAYNLLVNLIQWLLP